MYAWMGLMISCSFLTVNWIHSDLINLIFKLLPRSFFVIWPDCTGWSNFPRTPVLVQWRRPCPQIIPQVNSNLDSDLCLSHTQDSPDTLGRDTHRPTIWTMMSKMMMKKRVDKYHRMAMKCPKIRNYDVITFGSVKELLATIAEYRLQVHSMWNSCVPLACPSILGSLVFLDQS